MKHVFTLLCLLATSALPAQIVFQTDLYYNSGKVELTDEHKAELTAAFTQLNNVPSAFYIAVEGHTDNMGDASYNKTVSDERAANCAAWLKEQGFKLGDNATHGYAAKKPKVSNSTWKGKSMNRRVTINIGIQPLDIANIIGVDIAPQVVSFDATKGTSFTTDGGILITIPPSALVDGKGKLVKGNVSVNIKEFENKADFLVGGVTMDYALAGDGAFFNSMGMLNINASQNGQNLSVAKGKSVDMRFSYAPDQQNVGFYRYSPSASEWAEINKKGIDIREYVDPRSNSACPFGCGYEEGQGYGNMLTKGKRYSVAMQGDRLTDHYNKYYENDSIAKVYVALLKNIERQIRSAEKFKDKITEQYMFKASLRSKKCTSIGLSTADPKTEVKHIRGQRWKYYKKANNMNVDTLIETAWSDVKLLYNEENNEFRMALMDIDGNRDTMVVENDNYKAKKKGMALEPARLASLKRVLSKYYDTRASYSEKLEAAILRKEELDSLKIVRNKDAAQYILASDEKILLEMQCFWLFTREFMEKDKELELCFSDWVSYFDAHQAEMQQRYSELNGNQKVIAAVSDWRTEQQDLAMSGVVRNTLSVAEFGTYNCDQVTRLVDPVIIAANYKSNLGKVVEPVRIVIVDKTINGVISYAGGTYGPYNFGINRTSTKLMFAFDQEGNGYKCDGKTFDRIGSTEMTKELVITLEPFKVESKEELDALFAVN